MHCHKEAEKFGIYFERFANIVSDDEEKTEIIIEEAMRLFSLFWKGKGSRQTMIRMIYISVRLAKVNA